MNDPLPTFPFELSGAFGGFLFTDAGKRRMLLHSAEGGDCLLKVPRPLRRRIIGKFRPGEPIRVAGHAEQDPATGLLKRVVTEVLPDDADASAAVAASLPAAPPALSVFASVPGAPCAIKVCSKKNCWRQGGRELWAALQRELAAHGLIDQVALRQVGCLDRCKRAPNLDCGKREYSHCSPDDARAILERALGVQSPPANDL